MIYLMISPVMMTSEMLRTTLEMLQQKNTNTMQMMIEARLISFFTDCLFLQWEYLENIELFHFYIYQTCNSKVCLLSFLTSESENRKYENIFHFRECFTSII